MTGGITMMKKYLYISFLVVAVVMADEGLGRTENWRTALRATLGTGTCAALGGIPDCTLMSFQPRAHGVILREGIFLEGWPNAYDPTLVAQGDGLSTWTVQGITVLAGTTPGTEDASWIQRAVDQASPGDVVRLPAGRWEVKSMIVIPEGISLIGAGIAIYFGNMLAKR